MPDKVEKAVKLLYTAIIIGMLSSIYFLAIIPSKLLLFSFIEIIIIIIISLFLIYKIKNRKNWARITFLVMFILGLVPYINSLPLLAMLSIILFFGNLISFILEVIALIFLFQKQSSIWFKAKDEVSQIN